MHKILVIDDNKGYRTDLMEILGFENYVPYGAENGLIGLQMIRQHSPHLIVCDADMPIISGFEVLRMVKADPVLSKIPFILCTGREDYLSVKLARALGVDSYLTKPFSISRFLAMIVSLLREYLPDHSHDSMDGLSAVQ